MREQIMCSRYHHIHTRRKPLLLLIFQGSAAAKADYIVQPPPRLPQQPQPVPTSNRPNAIAHDTFLLASTSHGHPAEVTPANAARDAGGNFREGDDVDPIRRLHIDAWVASETLAMTTILSLDESCERPVVFQNEPSRRCVGPDYPDVQMC